MCIILAHPIDPESPRLGGANRYVFNIIKCLEQCNLSDKLLVLGTKLIQKNSSKFKFEFVPILKGTDNAWLYILKLTVALPFLRLPKNAIVHVQRTYFMIPFILWKPNYIKIVTMHTMPLEYVRVNHPLLYKLIFRLYLLLEKAIVRRLDILIAVNSEIAEFVRKTYHFNRCLVIPGAIVDVHNFKPANQEEKISIRNKLGIDSNHKVLLFVGRLEKIKRVDLLLLAFKYLKEKWNEDNLKLLIVGDGAQRNYLIQLAKKLGVDRHVIFTGTVPPEKIVEYYKASDLFVFTSVSEASPNVVREALASGLHVISTNVGDVYELRNLPCITIVPVHISAKELSETLFYLLRELKKKNVDYSKCVDYIVRSRYDLNTFCQIITIIYKLAINHPHKD